MNAFRLREFSPDRCFIKSIATPVVRSNMEYVKIESTLVITLAPCTLRRVLIGTIMFFLGEATFNTS